MSNSLRYDPLLVRALAAELRDALAGRMAHPIPRFDSDVSATLLLDGGGALRCDLHPRRGWIRLVSAKVREGESAKVDGNEPSARITGVSAPADERLLRIDFHEGNRFRGGRRSLVLELHTNQWNALVVDPETRRIVSVLRARDAGGRTLQSGAEYQPPRRTARILPGQGPRDEALAAWLAALNPLPPQERPRALIRAFAYTSPINAAALLGSAAEAPADPHLEEAFARWWTVLDAAAGAWLLQAPGGPQPYPLALAGVEARPADSLLGAMETLASAAPEDPTADLRIADLLDKARKRAGGAARRAERLRGEMAEAGDSDRLRALGDLVLANLQHVPPGASSVMLPDWDGGVEVEVPLDPTLRPHENAKRFYDEAAKRARAEAMLPELLAQAERDRERWTAAAEALERGEVPAWVPPALIRLAKRKPAREPGERLPYRLYRTSGGLEVRVGKTSKDNDRVTFAHAGPEDVWLHARQVPGSHVVLRWSSPDAPPARDLEEAAGLAAFYSKARTSGTVAVDWTRRKHVRKPRNAPPGRVTIQHARTVFVSPDAELEERLRAG